MNRVQQKSSKWGMQWARRKEIQYLLQPQKTLLQTDIYSKELTAISAFTPMAMDVQDQQILSLLNVLKDMSIKEIPQMEDITDKIYQIFAQYISMKI